MNDGHKSSMLRNLNGATLIRTERLNSICLQQDIHTYVPSTLGR